MSQSEIFLNGEADNWYQRNQAALDGSAGHSSSSVYLDIDYLCQTLHSFKSGISNALEIGCCNGAKLERICERLECSGRGIDPSGLAVSEGNQRLAGRNIQLNVGTASRLPYDTSSFDLVYFGFCLYLQDRQYLLAAFSEADRVLRSGGFLAITDFDPMTRHAKPYHHKTGVFSFKQDYAQIVTATGLYSLAYKHSFSHHQNFFEQDSDERVSTQILYKERS